MSFFVPPPKPKTALGWHRPLSPTASVKVSPIALGGISFGNKWSELFGKSTDASGLLDTFYDLGGNFIDTANNYNEGESEKLIGEWLEKRGVRDQMVIATKYGAGFRKQQFDTEPLQSNFTGASAKSLHISVNNSLKNLRTDYIDVLYLHWWDYSASVEEVMTRLHALVLAGKVLYLGISDTPAWIVVKANEYARRNRLTPFSVYQGRWNAAFRDMEAEIVPMCEDQGMGIVPWASLGGGQLTTAAQRKALAEDEEAPKGYGANSYDVPVSNIIERLANEKGVTFQQVALSYLFHQSTYVFPIVGVQSVEHVKAIPGAIEVKLSKEEIQELHNAANFNPLFPHTFLFDKDPYSTKLTFAHQTHLQMTTWVDAPSKDDTAVANSIAGIAIPVSILDGTGWPSDGIGDSTTDSMCLMSSAPLSSNENLVPVDVGAPSVIPVLPQLPNLRTTDEDWTGVTAQAKRRRLQNRINQRARRQRQKDEKASSSALAQRETLPDDVEEIPRNTRASSRILPARTYLLARPENRELLERFTALAQGYLGTPNLIHLEDTVRCNVFLALARNIQLLGFDDRWLKYDAISPFARHGPHVTSILDVPANMRPTALQLAVEHHPWIDLLPCPRMRDNFLQLVHVHGEDAVDEDDLCHDYVDAAGSEEGTEHGAAVIAWSDPWSPNGWEVTPGFLKKWGWLLHGCVELQAGTNAWRTRRGLPRLIFPGC